MSTFIIAEAGVGHAGRLDHALALVKIAADAGCDAVKFQAFTPTTLSGVDYAKRAMLKGLALTAEELKILAAECGYKKIEFMCTPMDTHWLDFCVDELKVKRVKIGSGQAGDMPFISAVAAKKLPVIISNGMAETSRFKLAASILHAHAIECDEVTLMSCVSKYPTPDEAVCLNDLEYLRDLGYGPVGFSSHSPSIWPTVAAVYAGAVVTENHIALPGVETPDYSSSLQPEQLTALVREIRYAERVRGASA